MTTIEAAVKAARDKFQGDDNDWIFLTTAERTALILTELAAAVQRGECDEMVEAANAQLNIPRTAESQRKCIAAALLAAGEENPC